MNDLTYTIEGLFTSFIPTSKEGEDAWRQLATQTQGTGKVLTVHLQSTLSQLRKAGYKVRKSKPSGELTPSEAANLLAELGL